MLVPAAVGLVVIPERAGPGAPAAVGGDRRGVGVLACEGGGDEAAAGRVPGVAARPLVVQRVARRTVEPGSLRGGSDDRPDGLGGQPSCAHLAALVAAAAGRSGVAVPV